MMMNIIIFFLFLLLLCCYNPTSSGSSPTPLPTAFPTFDTKGDQTSSVYAFFSSIQRDPIYSSSIGFGTYFFKGNTFYGDCTAWTDFMNIDLNPPVFGQPYFDSMNVQFQSYDYTVNKDKSLEATCSNATATNAIIKNLKAGLNVSISCGGYNWRTFKCGSNLNLCIDCPGKCDVSSCPSQVFIFNPCSYCPISNAMAGFLFTTIKHFEKYPVASTPVIIDRSKTSLTVALNMTSPGNIYCAPFDNGMSPKSLLEIKFKQNSNFAGNFDGGSVNITLNGLIPSTKYSIYCYTEDFFLNKMPLSVMKVTAINASTLCCGGIKVTKSFPFLYIKDRYRKPPIFKFLLTPKPTNNSLISLTVFQVKNCSSKSIKGLTVLDGVVQPSSYLAGPDISAELSFIVLSEKPLGCIAIEIKSNDTYGSAVVFTSINNLPIPPPTPQVLYLEPLNDGTISMYFDSNTDQAGYGTGQVWDCSQRLQLPTLNGMTYCKWLSPTQLIIVSKDLNVGDPVNINLNAIKAAVLTPPTYPDKYVYIPPSSYIIGRATSKVYFTPVLATPGVVNTCDQFEASTASVVGNGGRPWKTVQWNVSSPSMQTDLYNNFNTGPQIISSVSLSSFKLPQSGTYSISLQVSNLLQQKSMSSAQVTFTQNKGDLRVIILGSPQLIYYRNNELSLFASASLSSCADAVPIGTTPIISYKWVVYTINDVIVNPRIESNSNNPTNFRLDPFTLDSMTTYKVQVVAQYTNSKKLVVAGTAKIMVEVREAGAEVVIVGGSSISYLSSKLNVLVAVGSDLDYPEQSRNLTYRWACMLDIPRYGSNCPYVEDVSKSNLTLRASVFKPGYVYLFSVSVTTLRGYTALASTSVTFVNTTIPYISIDQPKMKYNVGERVILTSQSDFAYDGTLTWSTDSKDISSLQAVAITPLLVNCTKGLLSSQLVIAENNLLAGVSYKFYLGAKFDQYPGYSETYVVVRMNTAPYGGTLSVSPKGGFAMTSFYTLSAFSWTDDIEDFPLQYVFKYYTVDSGSTTLLVPPSEQTVVTVQLGLGNFLDNFKGTCSVTVRDMYGGGGTGTFAVTVSPFTTLTKDAVDNMNTMVVTASQEQNGVKVMQVLSSALSLINYQDCVLPADLVTKKITCSVLNRNECSNTAKTCGPCKAGFIGIFGDSNIPCTSGNEVDVGKPCTKASNCATGACTGFPKVCSIISKSCPNSCSGRGQCKLYDQGGNELSSCLVTDNFCEAVCVCGLDSVSGQQTFGKDCSVDSFNDFNTITSGRESICSTLKSTIDLQEFSYEIFLNYVSTIAGVVRDPSLLTDAGLATCINYLVDLSGTYPDYSSQSQAASVLLKTFANVFKKGNSFLDTTDVNTRSAFLGVMVGVQENMALGQKPLQVVTASVRSETSLNFVNDNFVKIFTIPRTPLEEKENINISSVAVAIKGSVSNLIGLGVTVTQSFQKRKGDTTYVSNTMGLDMLGYAKSTKQARRQLAVSPLVDVTAMLTNPLPVTYFFKPSSYHLLYCQISAEPYDLSLTCGNGRTLKHTCDGKKGTWTVSCGKFASVPVCKTWDKSSSSFIPDSQCSVVSYTSTQTLCLCSQKSLFDANQNNALKNSYQFAVGTGILYDDDISEYEPILGYTQRIKNLNSISYANGVIVGIFLVGAVFFLLWDLADGQARSLKIYEEMEKKIISKNNFKETLDEVRTMVSVLDKVLPRDFKTDNWQEHFWILMKKDYNFIALCMPEQFSGVFRLSNWILATWRYFPYVLGDTVLAYFLYADDGTCENTLNVDDCLSLKSGGSIRDLCEWKEDIQYCYYKVPDLSFYNIVMLAAAITVASHFANKFLEFVCHRAGDIEVFDTIYREVSKKDDSLDIDVDDDDDDEGKLPPPIKLDELTLAQTMKGKMLRAAKLSKSQELMDFVSPVEEKNLLLTSKLYTEKRYNEMLIMNLKEMGLVIPKDKLVAEARIEKKILTSIREARRAAKQMVKEMNNMKEDEEREVFLLKNFLVDRFRGPRKNIAMRYLFSAPPLGAAQKYTLLVIGFVCLILLPIIFALYLYITWTYDSYIGTRAIPLWSQVLTVAILLDLFILQWFAVWIKASIVEAAFGAEMSMLDRFFRRLGRIIVIRTSGLLRESNAVLHHFNPACRTARAFPSLPVARLLISLGDADLPPKQTGRIREFFFRVFMFFYSILTMVPENVEDFVIELLTIVFFYAVCVALNLISWIFSVIIAVFVFIAFFGQEIYYYYDYRQRNYRPTAKDVNVFLKEEQMILQRKKKRDAHNINKSSIWSKPIASSMRRFSLLVTKRLQKVGINNIEEEMTKKDEDPVPLGTLTVDNLSNHLPDEAKDNYDSVEENDNDSVEEAAVVPISYSIEQMKFAEKLKSPLTEKVTGGPIQNKKSGIDQQLEMEKKQKENTIGLIHYDLLNDPRAVINETEDDVQLVPFIKPLPVLGSSAFVKYNDGDDDADVRHLDTKEKYFVQHKDTNRREPAIKRPEIVRKVRAIDSDQYDSTYVDKYIYDESIGQYRQKTQDEKLPSRATAKARDESRERKSRKIDSRRRDKYEEKELTEEEMHTHGSSKRRLRSSKKVDTFSGASGPGAFSTTEMKALSGQIHEEISSKFLVLTKDDSEEIPYVDFINFAEDEGGEHDQDEVLRSHQGLRGPGALKIRPQTPPEEREKNEENEEIQQKDAAEYKTIHDMESHIYHYGIKVKHINYPTIINDEQEVVEHLSRPSSAKE